MAGKVLFVASECAPLVKTGGLADVVGALPGALAPAGWAARVLLPAYPGLVARLSEAREVWRDDALFGGSARVLAGREAGLELLLLEAPHLYDRSGAIYLGPDGKDWPDNPVRYAALSWVAAEIARGGLEGWRPDLVHLHDWQAGLTAAYLAGDANRPAVITTIHNIAFQGLAPAHLAPSLRLPEWGFNAQGFEYYGNISALKAGLVYSDAITTVSPTYAQELTTPEFGMGLEGVIQDRAADLYGILNGIDEGVWNPATDPALAAPYQPDGLAGKALCKDALEVEFGLTPGMGPVFAVISRLTDQKGLDLLLEAMPAAVEAGARFAILGSGDAALEAGYEQAAKDHPGRVAVRIGYDEALSHRMYAGADAVLVPSRFEPCGLTQLYGLRYGAVPVVSRTGGLADTVIDASAAALKAGVATGFQFAPTTMEALERSLLRAVALYRRPDIWWRIVENGMTHPVGWDESAQEYARLYAKLAGARA